MPQPTKEMDFLPERKVDRHLWHDITDQNKIHKGELTEEEVHGCVKLRISIDEEEEEDITTEGHCEDHHNNREEDKVSWTVRKNAQEDEVICG